MESRRMPADSGRVAKTHRAELTKELEAALQAKTAREWEAVLADAGVPAASVLTVSEALGTDHIGSRAFVHTVPLPSSSRTLKLLGSPVHVDGAAMGPTGPPPALGQHTEEILQELGYSAHDMEVLCAERAV